MQSQFCAYLGTGGVARPNKLRVPQPRQRIVDAVHVQRLDAGGTHRVEGAGDLQCAVQAAIAVGRLGHLCVRMCVYCL